MPCQPLVDAINNSISKGVFPDNAKIASVSLIDKQSDDKNKVSNFRTVSVLNIFCKIYESVTKNQLISVLNNIFSPYLRLTENLIAHSMYIFLIGNDVVEVASSVKLLGIDIDDQLSFNLYISKICKSASKQLNALVRLKRLLDFAERKVSINNFTLSNFNYFPLVWSMSSTKSLNKVENLQN